jgi:hypothetical protein
LAMGLINRRFSKQNFGSKLERTLKPVARHLGHCINLFTEEIVIFILSAQSKGFLSLRMLGFLSRPSGRDKKYIRKLKKLALRT